VLCHTHEWVMSHVWMSRNAMHPSIRCAMHPSIYVTTAHEKVMSHICWPQIRWPQICWPHICWSQICCDLTTGWTLPDDAYEWDMSHVWMNHATRMNELEHTCMNESCHTYEWVGIYMYEWESRHVTRMNERCHTYEWVGTYTYKWVGDAHTSINMTTTCAWVICWNHN